MKTTPMPNDDQALRIPTRWVGPIAIQSDLLSGNFKIPMSTYETPLWPSVNRGAKLSRMTEGGINVTLRRDCMARSVAVSADSAQTMHHVIKQVEASKAAITQVIKATSQHLALDQLDSYQVGNLAYFRLSCTTGNASGHNMITKAADAFLQWLLSTHPDLQYESVSGNVCTDKKNAAINGLLGRGKEVIAEMCIEPQHCQDVLRTTPEALISLHTKKNLIGSIVAGSVRSANAHFANMLLATYLATGQDAANIVEGSQGITHAELRNGKLLFSVTLPNLIVGTVGNGKHHPTIRANLLRMGCQANDPTSSQKLAILIAASVLCGELSLLAAQSVPGELMRAHLMLERRQHKAKP